MVSGAAESPVRNMASACCPRSAVLARLPFQIKQLRPTVCVDLIGLEHGQRKSARAAAGWSDRDSLAGQLRQPNHHRRAAVENGERHVEHASERYQIAGVAGIRDA